MAPATGELISPMAADTTEIAVTSSLGALDTVLGQLRSLLDPMKRLPLPKGVRKKDVSSLKDELEKASAYAMELWKKPGDPSLADKCWMQEVRELSYDADDYLDMVRHPSGGYLDIGWILTKIKRERLGLIPIYISHLEMKRQRRLLTARDILLRLKDAEERRKRYKSASPEDPPETLEHKAVVPMLAEPSDRPLHGPVSQQSEIEEPVSEPVSKQDNLPNELVSMLAFDTEKQLKVVPVLGSAGVGKTTLARRLYHYYGGRFNCRAFLCVSRKPNTEKLLASMLSQIKGRHHQGYCDVQALIDSIKKHLQGKSYLIIVDDIWATSVWDVISPAFPEGNCYSRIITTTEVEDIALACCSYFSKCIYDMRPFSDDQSGQLFLGNSEWLKKDINQKYNDLPPRLKTCLLYLNMYPEDHVIRKDDLVKQWLAEGFLGAIDGPDKKDVAGSYLKKLADGGMIFDKLVDTGMIQTVHSSHNEKVLSYTVNHMVVDLIARKSIEDNFITVVDYPGTVTGHPDKVRRLSVMFGGAKGAQVPGSFRISPLRSLTFSGFFRCLPSIVEYSLLRILILHIWSDRDLDLTIIGELFHLRYLKIECNMIVKLPAMIGGLQNLQTLEVYATVAAVPLRIGCLQRLLHLRLPSKTYLPHGIGHMALHRILDHVNLRTISSNSFRSHVLRAECYLLFTLLCGPDMPAGIGRMTLLRSLGNFDLSTSSSYSVLGLGNLTNLQDLHLTCSGGPSSHLVSNIKCLARILRKLSNLKSLILDGGASSSTRISCDALSNKSSQPSSQPSPNLETLELSPRIFILPSLRGWIEHLSSLCTLKIAVKEMSSDDVNILKQMTALSALSLYVQTAPEARIIFNDGFEKLKYFKFICSAPCMEIKKGAMHKVQCLKLGFNANTMQQFRPADAGFEHLTVLRVISAKIGGAGADQAIREAAKDMLVAALGKHPDPPIINVQLVDWRFDGHSGNSSADVITWGGADEQYGIGDNNSTEDTNILDDSRLTVSSESSLLLQNPGWKSWKPRDGVHLAETVRGLTYVIMQHMRQDGFHVNNEVACIKLELELMTVIINNSPGTLPEEWVKQLQDLAYDIEDFINIHGWLRRKSWKDALVHMTHIVNLKGRIRSLREWQQAAISSHGCGTGATSSVPSSSGPYYSPEDVLVGIKEPKNELLQLVLQEDVLVSGQQELRVVSVVGYRGIGKTALARAVYYDRRVRHEFDRIVWVVASECSHGGVLLNMIRQQVENRDRVTTPDFCEFTEILQTGRFLVIIDDLREAGAWYDIRSAFAGARTDSRIIVTTSIQSVATSCSTDNNIYRMRGLGDSESKELFWRRVYSRENGTPALEYALEDSLRKCGGLPLALISVANYLRRNERNLQPGAPGAFEEMNRVLTQCYDSLPDNGHRTCLLSLSTFPQGHLMRRNRLIRRWTAEGLVVADGELSAEQVAGERFDALIDRNIIEPVLFGNNSKVKGCLILGVIKDFIVNKSVSKEFVTLIRNDERLLPNKKGAHPVRRLSVHGGTKQSGRVAEGMGLDRVRSLTICNGVPFNFKGCWLLRVLDLEGCKGVDKKVLHSICKLMFLKYLSLRDSDVIRIPKEIKKLENLETLDIRETQVVALPIEVFMLPQLAHLFGQFELPQQLRDWATRSKLQIFFSEKSRLQTVSGFIMVENNNAFELIVLHMRLLRKVKIWCKHSVTSHLERLLASSLQKRFSGNNALESLSINFGDESMNFLNYTEAPCEIISIKLRGKLISLPSFITSHDTILSELQLSSTGLSIEDLSLLQNLRRLLYLKLSDDGDGFRGDCFVVRSGGFPSLLRLFFEARKLPQVHIHQGGMSSVTSLHLLCPEFAIYNNFKGNGPEKHFEGVDLRQKLKGIDSEKSIKGIEHLRRLNEVVLHPSVGNEELDAWKEEARRHINRPKVAE